MVHTLLLLQRFEQHGVSYQII